MAYILTDNDCIAALCSKCGQEVICNISTGITNGVDTWYQYHCQHCGYWGNIKIEPKHKTYSLEEILEKNKYIIKDDPLKRIEDSLNEIKELLKQVLNNDK